MRLAGTLYFDFLCPGVARLARVLEEAERAGATVELDWRPFSLEVVNAPDGLPLWEHPDRSRYGGIHALATHEWVRAQAPYAEAAYRRALLFLEHDERADFSDWSTYQRAAAVAGLESEPLLAAVQERREGYPEVGRSHQEAVSRGIFGVPTLAGPGHWGAPLFISLGPGEEEADPLRLLGVILEVFETPLILELKRPP